MNRENPVLSERERFGLIFPFSVVFGMYIFSDSLPQIWGSPDSSVLFLI